MDLLKLHRPNLRASSLKSYTYALRRAWLLSGGRGPVPKQSLSWITKELAETIRKQPQTRARNMITPLLILLKSGPMHELFRKLLEETTHSRPPPGTKTQRDEEQWLPLPEIVAVREALARTVRLSRKKLNAQQHKDALRYIYLCFITMHPPLRLDYPTLRFIDDPQAHTNLVSLPTRTLVLHEHKTVGKTGVHRAELSPELVEVLRKWRPHCKSINGRTFVFPQYSGKSYNRRGFGTWIRQLFLHYFDKPTSQGTVRKIYASHHFKPIKDAAERATLAKNMLHSPAVQNRYYLRD